MEKSPRTRQPSLPMPLLGSRPTKMARVRPDAPPQLPKLAKTSPLCRAPLVAVDADEIDPVCTLEFASHTQRFNSRLRAARRG